MKDAQLCIVLCTAPVSHAQTLARTLLEERRVACVNLMGVRSVYRWDGKVTDDDEQLLIMKAPADVVDALVARIPQIHPYSVPEVVVLPASKVLPDYLAWAVSETRQP
jgi:periplasmic divalent cation tolerance protein